MPFVFIPKDRLGFENRVGLSLVNGLLEFSKSLGTRKLDDVGYGNGEKMKGFLF